jgi:hypothetical protein
MKDGTALGCFFLLAASGGRRAGGWVGGRGAGALELPLHTLIMISSSLKIIRLYSKSRAPVQLVQLFNSTLYNIYSSRLLVILVLIHCHITSSRHHVRRSRRDI